MNIYYEVVVNPIISADNLEIAEFEITAPGTITNFRLKSDNSNALGDSVFDVLKNGSSIYALLADQPTIVSSGTAVSQSGLSIAVVEGDRIKIFTTTIPTGGIGNKLFIQLTASDGTNPVLLSTNQSIDGVKTFTSSPIVPTPTTANQVVNKSYADSVIAGLSWKQMVRLATTVNDSLSGLAARDGVTPIAGDRVLVKSQSSLSQNGIYIAASGSWTRATDADSSAELVNATVFVSEGTTLHDTQWTCSTDAPITIGSTSITFTQSMFYSPIATTNLTDVSFTSLANDDFFQRKAGNWVNRTIAQVKTDLGLAGTNSGDETATTIGTLINAATAATPNDSDLVATALSSGAVRKISWTNVKAFLKTYFDTFYQAILVSGTNIKTVNSISLLGLGNIAVTGNVATDTIFDAKGDLVAGTGADTAAKLTAGSNGTFLKADSTQSTGLIWASIPGGGDLLSTNNLSDVTSPSTARSNLGLAIGTNVQAWDTDLDTWAGKTAPSGTVVGTSDSQTLTNKTFDFEGTGNNVTVVEKLWLPAAGANGTTAAPGWDLPASTSPTATNVAGTNVHKAVLSFADSGNSFAENTILLPADWVGAIDAKIVWYSTSNTGNCKWFISTSFTDIGATSTDDNAYNAAQTVTTAAPGTANRITSSSITSLTATGSGAGYLMHIKIARDGTDGSDTLGAAALLVGVELTLRRTV